MDEFAAIASEAITDEFKRLTKAVNSWTDEQRQNYANRYPDSVWMRAGINEENSTLISLN